jgi:glycerol kinase
MNTGGTAVYSKNGLLTTVAYKINGEITYALEGSSYIAGAAVQWLRDNLNVITHSSDIEKLAKETTYDKVENILFLPFFTGIASPYWQSDAQAAIIGLTRDSGKPEIAQACLEGICLSINDLLLSVKKDSGLNLRQLKVDGGACANNHLMTLQSSFSQIEVVRPEIIETTAYGASLAAAVGLGDYKISELKNFWNISSTFTPDLVNKNYYQRKKDYWTKMIKKIYL